MVTNGEIVSPITVDYIPVAHIDPYALNRHCADDDPDVIELAQTIRENGLLSPISIRPMNGDRYEIICGERRWRAFRVNGQDEIPCIIKNLDDTQAQIERIVENYQRRDPSFMEQGEAVAALMELTNRDIGEIANRLGQSVSWVRRRAKLPNLIPAWRDELAKDNTPYFIIRDSVNKLEEIAMLPPATQQSIFDTNALRYVKTTKEMRNTIAKLFMNLDAKPWTRAWEKKVFSGSGKRRCDACMKRSDRESALFANPDDPGTGKKMCLDPQCWKTKCLSWCRSLIHDTPGMVPMRQGYGWHAEDLDEFFGVKPVGRYDWQERDVSETERKGYATAVGVLIDGPDIGTTRNIWLELPDESEDGDSDVSGIHDWRIHNANRHRERETLAELIAADIAKYLADIEMNATIPAAKLTERQLRVAMWFGISGYSDSEDAATSIGNPDWNPLAWAWEQTAEHIARHVAHVVAEDIAQLYNGDREHDADNATAAALLAMFEIPRDVIATRATEALYNATRASQDAEDMDGMMEDVPEPIAPAAIDMEELTDPDDIIRLGGVSYLSALADAQ